MEVLKILNWQYMISLFICCQALKYLIRNKNSFRRHDETTRRAIRFDISSFLLVAITAVMLRFRFGFPIENTPDARNYVASIVISHGFTLWIYDVLRVRLKSIFCRKPIMRDFFHPYWIISFLVVLFGLIFLLSGCSTRKPRTIKAHNIEEVRSDSSVYKETVKADTAIVPADTSVILIPISVDSSGNIIPATVRTKGSRSELDIEISGNQIKAKCLCKEWKQAFYALYKENLRVTKELERELNKEETVLLPVRERYVPRHYKILAWAAVIEFLLLILAARFIRSFIIGQKKQNIL